MIYDVNGTPTGIAYYDTVEAMKAAAPAVGTVVATGGYYTKGDGGAAMYSVSDAAGATVNGCTSFTGGGRAFEMLDDGRELNVLQCGMHTDGVTDNLAIFGLIKAAYPVRTLYFPKGVYAFAGAIVFDRCYCVLDNAELKCTSPGIIGRFVEIRGQMYPPERPQDDMFIRGNGIINANFKANTCLAVARQKHTLIDGVHIKNFQRYGIMSKFTDDSLGQNLSYELEVTDCLITNELSYSDAIGIVDFNDSTYTDIVILNVKTAIQASGSSVFHNIHAWCYDFDNSANRAELLTDTVFARITDNGARFSDCYCDTYQKGFVFANNISLAYVSNFKWFINLETWSDGVTPVAFNAGTNKTEYKVFGARVPKQGITKFSDVSLDGTGCEFYGVVSDADNAPTGIIDDTVIAEDKAWSSKHTVDKLLPMQTVTGNPAVIETLEGYPLELSASWEPKQEGSGTPSPDNVRPITGTKLVTLRESNANLLNPADFNKTTINTYGLTIEPIGENTIRIKGTYNESGARSFAIAHLNNYLLSGRGLKITSTATSGTYLPHKLYGLRAREENAIALQTDAKDWVPGTAVDMTIKIGVYAPEAVPAEYQPYTGEQSSLTLPHTIYGGVIDMTTGQGQEMWSYIDSYAGETLPGEWISDRDEYAAGATPTVGAQVAYKLATPVPFTATGGQTTLALAGTNAIITDADTLTITAPTPPQTTASAA